MWNPTLTKKMVSVMNEDFIRQIIFHADNVSRFFLSPYVDVVRNDGGICMKRHDSKNMIVLEPDAEKEALYTALLDQLRSGIGEEELMEILTAIFGDEAEIWYQNLIWEGIIE